MGKVKRLKPRKNKLKRMKNKIEVSLPKEKSIPSDKLDDYTILLYGVKKIGKTSMLQYFKNILYLMFEPGAKALEIYQRAPKNWAEFKEYVKLIEKDKTFRNIAIDPVDILFKMCQKYICSKLYITHPSEGEWGKGWQAVRDEFDEWVLGRLMNCGKGVIFVSHAKDAEIKTRVGDIYHKITSTMANQAKEAIEGAIDIWCHYKYINEDRVLTIRGGDHTDAGHRIKNHFRYTDNSKIRHIPMGKSEKEAYENFIMAFENKLIKPIKKKRSLKLKTKRRK